jgi:hypothetical protein
MTMATVRLWPHGAERESGMDSELVRMLSALPPLSPERVESRNCKVCGTPSPLFDVVDFNKICSSHPYALGVSGIPVNYYRCAACRLIFTDLIDGWTPEEVARFIYNGDYIKVDPEYVADRPLRTAIQFAEWLSGCEQSRILDYGSGSGTFADEMRRRGFRNIESYDPFSHPARPIGVFDLITCFEVIEHSPDPVATLLDMTSMLSDSGAILAGQTIQPHNIEEIGGRWWYLAPRNGHVSAFADLTFFMMAERAGLIYRDGQGLYGFARPSLAPSIRDILKPMLGEGWKPGAKPGTASKLSTSRLRALARHLLSPQQRRSIRSLANRLGLTLR